jgi:hypothetical protein
VVHHEIDENNEDFFQYEARIMSSFLIDLVNKINNLMYALILPICPSHKIKLQLGIHVNDGI